MTLAARLFNLGLFGLLILIPFALISMPGMLQRLRSLRASDVREQSDEDVYRLMVGVGAVGAIGFIFELLR